MLVFNVQRRKDQRKFLGIVSLNECVNPSEYSSVCLSMTNAQLCSNISKVKKNITNWNHIILNSIRAVVIYDVITFHISHYYRIVRFSWHVTQFFCSLKACFLYTKKNVSVFRLEM